MKQKEEEAAAEVSDKGYVRDEKQRKRFAALETEAATEHNVLTSQQQTRQWQYMCKPVYASLLQKQQSSNRKKYVQVIIKRKSRKQQQLDVYTDGDPACTRQQQKKTRGSKSRGYRAKSSIL